MGQNLIESISINHTFLPYKTNLHGRFDSCVENVVHAKLAIECLEKTLQDP